jgi:hypothetical protein
LRSFVVQDRRFSVGDHVIVRNTVPTKKRKAVLTDGFVVDVPPLREGYYVIGFLAEPSKAWKSSYCTLFDRRSLVHHVVCALTPNLLIACHT